MPYALPSEMTCAAQAEAMFALGRLDGALRFLPDSAARILAARLLRECLIAALRQEGHMFTPPRFHAWFAGLTTLTDPAERVNADPRPPRAMTAAILGELSLSSWEPLASLADMMAPAFLAVGDGASGSGHGDAHTLMEDARELLEFVESPPSPLPFDILAKLHGAVAGSTAFSPSERVLTQLPAGDCQITIERSGAPSPRWALEVQLGAWLKAAGFLSSALPLMGLIRLDALVEDEDGDAPTARANALAEVATALFGAIVEARALADQHDAVRVARRSSSRVPELFALLAGFGTMRSSQLACLLGASRLGLSKMLGHLDDVGVLRRSTIASVHLYSIVPGRSDDETTREPPTPLMLSSGAVAEYDAAMAHAEAVLARIGADSDDEDDA